MTDDDAARRCRHSDCSTCQDNWAEWQIRVSGQIRERLTNGGLTRIIVNAPRTP